MTTVTRRIARFGRRAASLAILLLASSACGGRDATTGAVSTFTVEPAPVLDIGDEAKGPQEEFSGTVIPVRLGDGTIVVANSGSHELRLFDATGAFVRSVGRNGEGPGEFRSLGWLHAGPGDTLRTYDWSLLRIQVFAPDGSFQRSTLLGAPNQRSSLGPVGVLDDGRIVMSTQAVVDFGSRDGAVRDTTLLLVYTPAGELTDTIGIFPGSESWIVRTQSGTVMGVSVSNRPFGKSLALVTHGREVVVGTADTTELRVISADGAAERVVRWRAPPEPVTPDDIAAYKAMSAEGWPAGMEARRDRFLARLEDAPYAAVKPAYSDVIVAADGAYWVRRYTMRADGAGATFDIFEPSGAKRGECTMPARFTLAQVTSEYALGTWKDPDDVVHVRMYKFADAR